MTANNTESNTVELTPLDFNNAAELLAAAFFDNPLHIYLFPNPANRFKAIRWMLRSNLNINLNSQKNIILKKILVRVLLLSNQSSHQEQEK